MKQTNSNVSLALELASSGNIKESLSTLESLSNISEPDFLFLLESSFLKSLFEYFTLRSRTASPIKLSDEDAAMAFKTLAVVHHVLDSPYEQVPRLLMKTNIKDFLCVLAQFRSTSERAFHLLSEVALFIPEVFSKEVILKLQRCLIEKCTDSVLRLEHFLRIFFNLREHEDVYALDAYFYVNFLRLQYSASQKQRMTRTSILLIIETLEHLITKSQVLDETVTLVFSFISDCFYPRVCMEYHIVAPVDSSAHKSDELIQQEILELIQRFTAFDYVPLAGFVAKQVDGLKFILSYKKRETALQLVLSLFLHTALSKEESIATEFIQPLLKWEKFQKTFDALAYSNYKKMSTNKRIVEGVCDLLFAIMKRDEEYITDFFLNEFLIGEMADLCSTLDRRRRAKGAELLIKVLHYIDRQPMDKFIFEDDEMTDLGYTEQEIEDVLTNKIIVSSVIDVFEVASVSYGKFGVAPSQIVKMQQLSQRIRLKMHKHFGTKFPSTLGSAYTIPTDEKKRTSNRQELIDAADEDWEDVDDNERGTNNQNINNSLNHLEEIVKQFFK